MSAYDKRLLAETICTLPKHDGQTWAWILDRDPDYAAWAAENIENMSEELRTAIENEL